MSGPEPAGSLVAEPLSVLYDAAPGPATRADGSVGADDHRLPDGLGALYGGDLRFSPTCLYANFVSSIDGVVALGPQYRSSGSAISGREPADRFVMGLLRACASAVLIGAGTLRATPSHRWTPQHVYPAAADEFAELRRARSFPADPELIVVTASGDLPADHPALRSGAVTVATTAVGARRLADVLPPNCTVLSLGDGTALRPAVVLEAVRERGHATILSEAGPKLIGQFVDDSLLDELFLTVAPVLAGRAETRPRSGLVAGVELLPDRRDSADLIDARRRGSYLFLRYRFHGGRDGRDGREERA